MAEAQINIIILLGRPDFINIGMTSIKNQMLLCVERTLQFLSFLQFHFAFWTLWQFPSETKMIAALWVDTPTISELIHSVINYMTKSLTRRILTSPSQLHVTVDINIRSFNHQDLQILKDQTNGCNSSTWKEDWGKPETAKCPFQELGNSQDLDDDTGAKSTCSAETDSYTKSQLRLSP
jgi:hypothetical protein